MRLTLDGKLQARVAELAQAAVAQGRRLAAAAVVLDVDTGEVLARAQVPDYDPAKADWQGSRDRRRRGVPRPLPRRLRRMAGQDRGPGRVPVRLGRQLITALAAARAGASDARYACRDADAQGPLFTLRGWPKPIHDHSGDRPHGTPDLAQAIAVSCNVYFGQLAALGPAVRGARARRLDVGFSSGGAGATIAAAFQAGPPGSRQLASTAFGQGAMVMSVMHGAQRPALASGGRYVRLPSMERAARAAPRPR